MEECPGPVLSFCRQPESEQEQLACGSSRGEQQFGSVWFHGWKHLQVRNPLFSCLLCETLHCVICDTRACSQTRLGTPLPSVRPCLCLVGQTLSSVKPCLSVRPSVRSCLLWDPGFCEALPFCETLPSLRHNVGPSVKLCFLWDLAFCEALPSARPFLLWELGLSSTCDTLCSVKSGLCFRCETMPCVSPCYEWHALLSVRPCPLWDLAFCETLPLFNGRYPVFCEALPFCETLPSLMCETLPSVLIHLKMFDGRDPALPCPLWDPAISSSFIWRCFDLQETGDHCCPDSPLRITCDGSAHRLCTNLSPWHCKLVLDTIQAHWLRSLSHSSRKKSNSQIVMFLCPLSCCHIFFIIFHYFP